MAREADDSQYSVCLFEGGAEGRVLVDIDAYLLFNAWIDQRLGELEAQWHVPRFQGSARNQSGQWSTTGIDE